MSKSDEKTNEHQVEGKSHLTRDMTGSDSRRV